jgi:hypothetical protein
VEKDYLGLLKKCYDNIDSMVYQYHRVMRFDVIKEFDIGEEFFTKDINPLIVQLRDVAAMFWDAIGNARLVYGEKMKLQEKLADQLSTATSEEEETKNGEEADKISHELDELRDRIQILDFLGRKVELDYDLMLSRRRYELLTRNLYDRLREYPHEVDRFDRRFGLR